MRHLIVIAALSLSSTAAFAVEPTAPSQHPMHHEGTVPGTVTGGGGAGKATFKEFTVTKKTDSASTGLAKCAGGATVQGPDGTQVCDVTSSAKGTHLTDPPKTPRN